MSPIIKNRALIYLRVSTAQQANKELPLETQKHSCVQFAQAKGYVFDQIADIYSDRVSGRKIEGRASLQLLLERCKKDQDIKAVIIYDISRLARNAIEYYLLKASLNKAGALLLSVNENIGSETETPADWMLEHIMAGFAEFRSRQDGDKIKNSMRNKVEQGGWCGYAPYGYKNVQEKTSSSKSRRWVEVNEQEAPWVRRCHDLFSTGEYTLERLAEKLQEEGMKVRNKAKIHHSFVERVLKNDTYIGVITWGGIRNENGKHKHIVPKDVFYRNQAILVSRNAGASRSHKHFFLLRAIGATCGECGSRWTAGYHKGRSKKHYALYSCTKKQKGKRVPCKQSTIRVVNLELQLSELFHQIEIKPSIVKRIRDKVRAIFARDTRNQEELREALANRREALNKAKQRLLEAYLAGLVEIDLYETKKLAIESEEQQVEKDLGEIEGTLKDAQQAIELALSLAGGCYRAYKKAPNDELRALLAKAFFKSIVLKDGLIVKVELNAPFNFLLETKLNKQEVFKQPSDGGSGRNRTAVQKKSLYDSTMLSLFPPAEAGFRCLK